MLPLQILGELGELSASRCVSFIVNISKLGGRAPGLGEIWGKKWTHVAFRIVHRVLAFDLQQRRP
jgi:hypothetical protein